MQEIWRDRSRRQLRKLSCSQRSRKEGVVSRLEGWGEARKGLQGTGWIAGSTRRSVGTWRGGCISWRAGGGSRSEYGGVCVRLCVCACWEGQEGDPRDQADARLMPAGPFSHTE